MSHLHCYTTSVRKLQEVVAQVLHPVDVDFHIWCPMETLYQSPGSIVHTHPSNNLGDKKPFTESGAIYYALSGDNT